ncbi:class I SAM-dependent methyltransferase [Bradyrhizobium sp. 62B]|uniref:class I SAM-dependent methyltransferase n=1 Tax=Bradyrhizobium sp. 62B TaxID=2898442 RepID=UPI0025582C47|nr:class I SAM-dependent methyltransferase [Bradyrhizobium sp. 62B]
MASIPFLNSKYPETLAGGFDRYDGTLQFYIRVNSLLKPDFTVLDFGAGRGKAHLDEESPEYRRAIVLIKGKVKEIIGADVDEVVTTNPGIDRAIVLKSSHIPLPDASVDLIVSDFTFEHIPDPSGSAAELDRILKPGGWICARTPNRRGYIALFNTWIPESLRRTTLKGAQPDRKDEDIFPAVYRLNDTKSLTRFFPRGRYEHASYTWDAAPSYHFGRRWIHTLFVIAQYFTPPSLRTVIMIFIRKRL